MRGTILVLVLGGAAAGCTSYNVHRAALGPHPEPVLYGGDPSEAQAEIGLGASSIAHFMKISKGNDETAVEVPGTQARADARIQVNDVFALGFAYENGIAATSQQPPNSQGQVTQPKVDNGDVQGFGMLADVSIATNNPNLFVGLHFDMTIWRVPWVEYDSSTDPNFPWVIQQHGTDDVADFAFAVTPTYRSGNLTWFGGLTARQHPTIQEKDVEIVGTDLDGDVHSGPFNFILSAGLEAKLGKSVKGSLVLYQDLSQNPNNYGPAAAAMVIIPLGHRHKAPAASAAPPPPPPPAPTTAPAPPPPPPPGPPASTPPT